MKAQGLGSAAIATNDAHRPRRWRFWMASRSSTASISPTHVAALRRASRRATLSASAVSVFRHARSIGRELCTFNPRRLQPS
jgi:hypothetical protein